MDDRWATILGTAGHSVGTWVALPENGLGALIAYAAGPGHVRPHDVPLGERQVRVEMIRDGHSQRWTEQMTPDDLATIASAVGEYLEDVGIPASPFTWWEINLPDAMTGDELSHRVHEVAVALEGEEVGVARARREARAVFDYVQGLYDCP